jgi:hypothetical protein
MVCLVLKPYCPHFLYHAPVDEDLVDELLEMKNVRESIIGNNQSVSFYNKSSCGQEN